MCSLVHAQTIARQAQSTELSRLDQGASREIVPIFYLTHPNKTLLPNDFSMLATP